MQREMIMLTIEPAISQAGSMENACYNNNNIQFLETHNTIKIVSMRVKSKYWTEIMKFQN